MILPAHWFFRSRFRTAALAAFPSTPRLPKPAVFALAGYSVHLADSQSARFSLGGMNELLAGKVQAGFGDASRWLKLFNVAYREARGRCVPRLAEHRARSRV